MIGNICCTYNRANCLERSIKCFLDQDYEGEQVLLVYNTGEPFNIIVPTLPLNKDIICINNQIDYQTKQPYTSVGAKYRDALTHIGEVDVITSWDDDDIFLPHFNRLGIEGIQSARANGKKAYKTYWSYFRSATTFSKETNNFEPSIFVDAAFIKEHGYLPTTVSYHDGWYKPLLEHNWLMVDKEQVPLFIYDWHPEMKIWKLSGGPDNLANFITSQIQSNITQSFITPLADNSRWYDLTKQCI